MSIDVICQKCGTWFDGHWHEFPDLKYKCPNCCNTDQTKFNTQTDEVYDNE